MQKRHNAFLFENAHDGSMEAFIGFVSTKDDVAGRGGSGLDLTRRCRQRFHRRIEDSVQTAFFLRSERALLSGIFESCFGDLQEHRRKHRMAVKRLTAGMLQAGSAGICGDSEVFTFLPDHLFQKPTTSSLRRALAGWLNGKAKGTLHRKILPGLQADLVEAGSAAESSSPSRQAARKEGSRP